MRGPRTYRATRQIIANIKEREREERLAQQIFLNSIATRATRSSTGAFRPAVAAPVAGATRTRTRTKKPSAAQQVAALLISIRAVHGPSDTKTLRKKLYKIQNKQVLSEDKRAEILAMIEARAKLRQAKYMAKMSGTIQTNVEMANEEAFIEAVDAEVDELTKLLGVTGL